MTLAAHDDWTGCAKSMIPIDGYAEGLPVDYHTLADFRVAHQEALDKLLTEIIATMMNQKLVTLKRVAQDGTRVRAGAGAGSFRRKDSLERCLAEAEEQVRRLKEEREHPDPEVSLREQAARERVVRDRAERVKRHYVSYRRYRHPKSSSGRAEAKRSGARSQKRESLQPILKRESRRCRMVATARPTMYNWLPM